MLHHILNLTPPPEDTPDECIVHGWSYCGQVAQVLTAGAMREVIAAGFIPPPVGHSPCPACIHGMTGMTQGPADCTCDPAFIDHHGYVRHTATIEDFEHNEVSAMIDETACPVERRTLIALLVARDGFYLPSGGVLR